MLSASRRTKAEMGTSSLLRAWDGHAHPGLCAALCLAPGHLHLAITLVPRASSTSTQDWRHLDPPACFSLFLPWGAWLCLCTSCTLHRRRRPLAGFSLAPCFTLAFIVVSFTLPTVIHSWCFQTILLGIVLLTWGPWFPGSITQSVVLRCLHPGHPHHPVGPAMWASPSPAWGWQALMSWSLAYLALRDIMPTIQLIHKEPFHCAHFWARLPWMFNLWF